MRFKTMICLLCLCTQQIPTMKAMPPDKAGSIGFPYEASLLTVLSLLTICLINYVIGKEPDKVVDKR